MVLQFRGKGSLFLGPHGAGESTPVERIAKNIKNDYGKNIS